MYIRFSLAATFAVALVLAAPSSLASQNVAQLPSFLVARDGDAQMHEHRHHDPMKIEWNETEFLIWQPPTPPSYWTHDFVDSVPGQLRYPGLIAVHGLFMSLAFFGALPVGIAMRSVNHAWHGLTMILFYTCCAIGISASMLYRKLTPDMYEGNKHGFQGYLFLGLAATISAVDAFSMLVRFTDYVGSVRSGAERFSVKSAWNAVVVTREDRSPGLMRSEEYAGLVADTEDFEAPEGKVEGTEEYLGHDFQSGDARCARFADPTQTTLDRPEQDHNETVQWANSARVHTHRDSYPQFTASQRTLLHGAHSFNPPDDTLLEFSLRSLTRHEATTTRKVGRGVVLVAERILVLAGLGQFLSGVVVYTGGCRPHSYITICLAHLIKGGVLWSYGLVSFARYLGAFSELGWAWNRAPRPNTYPTAEFIESLSICLYGASNTWLERLDAETGSPFTTRQIQHIGIAVVFWFAGALAMGIESRTVRRWLASGSASAIPPTEHTREVVAEPPSYIASFNPFPALCIGITGIALGTHQYAYVFMLQIHALGGYLFVGAAAMRFLTYFFLWLSPPRSFLPSRPPTEALGSFFLTCGGLMIMFSTEEVAHAALRQGRDDVMMFLNIAVAITCLAFCWTLGVVAYKGWLRSRTLASTKFRDSA